MKDAEVLEHVTKRFDALDKKRKPYETKWRRWYKMYRQYIEDKEKRPNGANLYIPYVFSAIETVKPRIINTMFAARPYVGLISLDPKLTVNAETHTNLMDYQFNHKMGFIEQATLAVGNLLLYGTGFTKQTWKYQTKKRKKREQNIADGKFMGYNTIERDKVLYDDPYMLSVDIFDFYLDPAIYRIEDQPDVIHTYKRPLSDYEQLVKDKAMDKKVFEALKNSGSARNELGVSMRLSDTGMSGESPVADDISIMEYWTDDYYVVVGNKSVVIARGENPYWHGEKPFKKMVDIPVQGEAYGIGECEAAESLQLELNATRNQRIDNISLVINRMWKVLRGSNIDPEQLVATPGGIIEVDSMDELEELKMTDVSQSAYREEEVIKRDIDSTLGVYDYAKGASPTRRETATTSTILAEASNERFKLKIMLLETTWLIGVANQIAALNEQYYDKEKVITLMRDNSIIDVQVSPELLGGEFEFMATGSSVDPIYNKAVRQQSLMQLFGVVNQMPFINLPVLVKKIFDAFDIKDTRELIQPMMPQMPMSSPPVAGGPINQPMGTPPVAGDSNIEAQLQQMADEMGVPVEQVVQALMIMSQGGMPGGQAAGVPTA